MERIKKMILLGLPLSEREKAEFMLFYENEELARLMFNGVGNDENGNKEGKFDKLYQV